MSDVHVEQAQPATASSPAGPAASPPPQPASRKELRETIKDVWYLKWITFENKPVKIITQNFNGPCSLLALSNILILRGDIEILPPQRKSVSYEFLSQLIAEYLLTAAPDMDIDAALAVMPLTQRGMDLNPVFTSPTSFKPSGYGGELDLFKHCGIDLVHGWLVDPNSAEGVVLARMSDYDSAVMLIADVDHLTKGQFVTDETQGPVAGSSSAPGWSEKDRRKIEDAMIVQRFLDSSDSQLTYHGLFQLAGHLETRKLVALFRGSHLSVLYKSPIDENIYSLVTDAVFLNEPSIIWERFEDVDGSSSWVDADFIKSSPAGGDFAGRTVEDVLRAAEAERQAALGNVGIETPGDDVLAAQLQKEEQDEMLARQMLYHMRLEERAAVAAEKAAKKVAKKEKKGDCIIM
ncbi:hypothetical protein DL96DRAFT_183752 [Flagelloscypha sp. PMI_526]|nr:hypothetical protein DL96DRAFT_183752 [Flagelloscypha sp. PMI_526]